MYKYFFVTVHRFKSSSFKGDELVKSQKMPFSVIPAKAGIQYFQIVATIMDSGFHRSDDFLRVHQFLMNS